MKKVLRRVVGSLGCESVEIQLEAAISTSRPATSALRHLPQIPNWAAWLGGILLILGGVHLALLFTLMIRLVPDQDVAKRQTQAASAVNQTVHAPSAPLPNNASLFQDAARQAAIGDGRSIPLSTIDTDQPGITVIRLSRDRLLENQRLSEPAWVSLPPELLALCRGKSDALLAIQRVLGTPAYETIADRDAYALYQFVVPPVALFRPCASGAHVTDRTCATRPPKQQDTPIDLEARNFALQTYWDSFHPSPGRKAYPFTGMGWSYDWSPESTTRVGISELLVKAETSITAVK